MQLNETMQQILKIEHHRSESSILNKGARIATTLRIAAILENREANIYTAMTLVQI